MDDLTPTIPNQAQEMMEQPTVVGGVVDLPINDNDFVAVVEQRMRESDAFYKNDLKLDRRAEMMTNFWLGNQLDESLFFNWQVPYKDNIIWQDLEQRIAIAAAKMPDIVVTPADDSQEKRDSAKEFEKALTIKVKNDVAKRLIKDGLRQLHLNLRAAIKVRWDKNRGQNGDFVFELVRPNRFGLDHTATIPHDGFTTDNVELSWEILEEPVGVICAKFPAKAEEFKRALGIVRGTSRQMISKVKYLEVWFTWYGKDGKIYEGVGWKYNNIVLGKMKNPYWDWEGYEKASEDKVNEQGQPIVETIYRNHFDRPRKPYILFSYQNLGRSPIDDTSAVEQGIPLQKTVNKRGRQITEIADRAVPKIAFSGLYITKEEARRVTNDPDEHIWISGAQDIRQAVQSIPANQPSPILYNDLIANRGQIDSKFSTHGTSRGETQGGGAESGVARQITREGDLVASDDIASVVVERVIYEMANWATQMMKINYDKEHFVKDLGKDGEMVHVALTQDRIDDGIAVNVKATSVDKATRRNDAMNLAARKAIDPLTLMEDLDVPNPKERTKRLIFFLTGSDDGFARYMELTGLLTPEEKQQRAEAAKAAAAAQGLVPPGGEGGAPGGNPTPQPQPAGMGEMDGQKALLDMQRMMAGEEFDPEAQPNAEYIQTFMQFITSGDFDSQPDEVKGIISRYVDKLEQLAQGAMGGGTPPTAPGTTVPQEEVA